MVTFRKQYTQSSLYSLLLKRAQLVFLFFRKKQMLPLILKIFGNVRFSFLGLLSLRWEGFQWGAFCDMTEHNIVRNNVHRHVTVRKHGHVNIGQNRNINWSWSLLLWWNVEPPQQKHADNQWWQLSVEVFGLTIKNEALFSNCCRKAVFTHKSCFCSGHFHNKLMKYWL